QRPVELLERQAWVLNVCPPLSDQPAERQPERGRRWPRALGHLGPSTTCATLAATVTWNRHVPRRSVWNSRQTVSSKPCTVVGHPRSKRQRRTSNRPAPIASPAGISR